jgi:hypothetical protein
LDGVTPQLCSPPATTWRNWTPPLTAAGCGTEMPGCPIPTSPEWFEPQQYALLSVVTPQVCWSVVSVACSSEIVPPPGNHVAEQQPAEHGHGLGAMGV